MDVLAEVPDTHATKWQAAHHHTTLTNEKERATAAVLQYLFLSALLGYIPYALSCLPQPAGERLTPGKIRKGEMGNCRVCPTRKRLLLHGKPRGGQLAVTGQEVGTQNWPQLDLHDERLTLPGPLATTRARFSCSLCCLPSSFIFAKRLKTPPPLYQPLLPRYSLCSATWSSPRYNQPQPSPPPPQYIPHSPSDRGVSRLGTPPCCIAGKGEQQNIIRCEKLLGWEGRQLVCESRKIQKEKLQSKAKPRWDTEW